MFTSFKTSILFSVFKKNHKFKRVFMIYKTEVFFRTVINNMQVLDVVHVN